MTLTDTKQRVAIWIAAALFAFGLASAPIMTGSAEAGCSIACVSTTGDEECVESIGQEGVIIVCTTSGT